MPRDINGVYTLPAPMPVQPRTIPVTNVFNTVLADVKDALNNIPGDALAPGSVDTAQLADGAVTNAKTNLSSDLKIRGTGTGAANFSAILFMENDGTTRVGFVGDGSGVNHDIYLGSDFGAVRLLPAAADPVVALDRGQLRFPAIQNPSTDPNTLDDYEEGTWTPTLEFVTPGNASIVYSQRFGKYTKIGDVVHVQAWINTSTFTHTTASGFLSITGLPFPVGNSNGLFAALGTYGRGFVWEPTYFHSFAALATGSLVAMYLVGGGMGGSTTATRISEARHTSGANVEIIVGGTYKV